MAIGLFNQLPKGLTSSLVFAISAAAFGSSFQYGYNIGVINTPKDILIQWINITQFERNGGIFEIGANNTTIATGAEFQTKGWLVFIWSIVVSIFCAGGIVGALLTSFIADKFGRKGGLLLNNILAFIAAACLGFSQLSKSYELLIAGRFIIGINAGLNTALAPLYLAEIAPTNLRGAIGTIHQLVTTISILVSQILGLPMLLGSETLWPLLLGFTAGPAIFQIFTLPFCPETPRYLLMTKQQEGQAQKALIILRKTMEVHDEMDEIRGEYEQMKSLPKVTQRDMFKTPMLRIPLIIAVMMMLAQQFSGINAVMYFSTEIFIKSGLTLSQSQFATLGMGSINVLMTLVSMVLVEKAGRRTLLLVGLGGIWIDTILLVLAGVLYAHFKWTAMSIISIILIFMFIVLFATGLGSIPWFLVTEIFTQAPRGLATGNAVLVNWLANFLVGLGFLPLALEMQEYIFLVFTALVTIFLIYTYKRVPETKNKTIEEIQAVFRQRIYEVDLPHPSLLRELNPTR